MIYDLCLVTYDIWHHDKQSILYLHMETRHFWLSNTPEVVGSASWGNSVKRMVTWVRFRDLKTNKEFYFWNTHFDHRSQPSREKSAQLILNRVKALKTKLPVILVGDFNAVAKVNRAYDTLTGQGAFEDSFETADKKVKAIKVIKFLISKLINK